MTQVEKRIENKLSDSVLMEFLGAENVEQLKVRIVDAIVQKVIEDLENEQALLMTKMSSPDYHNLGVAELKADAERAQMLETRIQESYERWEALEAKRLQTEA